jgi:transcriptional regulator with XRE-family HTH domain
MKHENYLIQLGEKIKYLRKDLGLSQEELGEAIGSNRLTILRIESGKVNSTIGMLIEISNALKVELGDLVTL